jgi:hypothetical protein
MDGNKAERCNIKLQFIFKDWVKNEKLRIIFF